MHGLNAQFPFFWTSMFSWKSGTNCKPGNNRHGDIPGFDIRSFRETCLVLGQLQEGRWHCVYWLKPIEKLPQIWFWTECIFHVCQHVCGAKINALFENQAFLLRFGQHLPPLWRPSALGRRAQTAPSPSPPLPARPPVLAAPCSPKCRPSPRS